MIHCTDGKLFYSDVNVKCKWCCLNVLSLNSNGTEKNNRYVRLQRFSPALPESDVFACVLERVDDCCGPAQTMISWRFNSFHVSLPAGHAQQFEDVFRCSQHRRVISHQDARDSPVCVLSKPLTACWGKQRLGVPQLINRGAPLRKLACTNKDTV